MNKSAYEIAKGLAYPALATIASCDHPKAVAKGYKDGWQLLMDSHDGNEMFLFCQALPSRLSDVQSKVLLDGLAREYANCNDWAEFVDLACSHPDWKPSRGSKPVRA